MKKNPLVSVIMPVYNAEKFLKYSIESILNQTYKNFEFIIIDDHSTDKSWKIINEYAKKDKRIKAYRNDRNINQSKTVFKAINLSRGKYIVKLDNDDISEKDRIKVQVAFFENNSEYVVVGSFLKIINENNDIIGYRTYPVDDVEIKKTFFFKSPFAYPSICIKKSALQKIKYPIKFSFTDDYLLWYELLKIGKGYNINKFLVQYRIHDQQVKNFSLKKQLQETIEVQKIIFKKSKPPFLAYLNHFFLRLLYLFPARVVLWLFKLVEYKKLRNFNSRTGEH